MIRILADENLPPALVGAIRQRIVEVEIETTHELGLDGSSDPYLLEKAGANDQVVLTMDHRTMHSFANGKSFGRPVDARRDRIASRTHAPAIG